MCKRGLDFLKTVSQYITKTDGFDRLMKGITLVDGGQGNCKVKFTVGPEHLNRAGGLHGGWTAALVDNITTLALMTHGPEPRAGVSVDLHVSYLKAAFENDVVLVDATTVKAGRTLAFLRCELKHEKDGSIIALGQHTKYVGG